MDLYKVEWTIRKSLGFIGLIGFIGFRLRVLGLGFRVWGLGFWV